MESSLDKKQTSDQFVYPVGKNSFKKAKKKKKVWEGSKADKANDKKLGLKEGSKADNAMDKKMQAKMKKKKFAKAKPQGKGIVKALGQKGTTGNFKKIEAAKGKGAAIGALQNKLAAHRGQPAPYGNKKKATGKELLGRAMKSMC
jgi:hypothetical protein